MIIGVCARCANELIEKGLPISIENQIFIPTIKEEQTKYKNAICRGSFILGTACGICEKCIDELQNINKKTNNNDSETITAKQKRDMLNNYKLVSEEIYHTNNAFTLYPKANMCKNVAQKFRDLGYRVNNELVALHPFGDEYRYKVSWEREYNDDELGDDNYV